jgi:2-octaprenyl-6-methoxyphenol hydroxylase
MGVMMEALPLKSTPHEQFDVVIGGAGPTGLVLARALAVGFGPSLRIALVSRYPVSPGDRASQDDRATALSAASVCLLDQIGAWTATQPFAQPVTSIEITDSRLSDGVRPVLLTYDNVTAGGDAASMIVPNGAINFALLAQVRASPSITILDGLSVIAFEAGTDGVTVTLDGGKSLRARLLLAADGARSPLRTLAGIKTLAWVHDQIGITTLVAHDRPHGGRAIQHFLPGGPFAMLPLPGDRSCITWSEDAALARRLVALDDAAFLTEIDRRVGGRLGTLRLVGPRQSWPLETSLARTFIGPRFALVGDAAHNVHPIAGQGLNLGLRDVAALAESLVDTARLGLDIGGPAPLARYERWRRFDTASSAAGFGALNTMFSSDGPLQRAARDFGLGLVNRMPGLKKRLVSEAAGLSGDVPKLLRGEAL